MTASLTARLLPLLPYWQWWVSELGTMLPARIRHAVTRPQVRIRTAAASVELERSSGGRGELHRDERPLAALDDEAWEQMASLCEGADVVALLPEAKTFGLALKLPRATLRSLDDAIRLQLLREAPLSADALLWTRQVERVTKSDVEVTVQLARRADVEALAAHFTSAGMAAPAIGCDGPSGIALLRPGDRTALGHEDFANRRAAWIALALLVSIPITTLSLLALRANATEQAIAALSASASERTRAMSKLRAASVASRELSAIGGRQPMSAAIEKLATALPQGAWLAGIRMAPETGIEADIVTSDPASLRGFTIVDQTAEGEGRVRVTVRAPR